MREMGSDHRSDHQTEGVRRPGVAEFLLRYEVEFIINSFMGWVYEITCVWLVFHYYADRGVMTLPLIPIYAFGGFLLLLFVRKIKNTAALFVVSFFVTTVFELISSYVLEWIYGYYFWTYSGWPLSIMDRSCVFTSLIFAVMAVFYFKVTHPLTEKIYGKIKPVHAAVLDVLIAVPVLSDLFISLIREYS